MANIGRENEFTEFKESTSEFDKAYKAIVGMLNKVGYGTVYFGVKDNGDIIGQDVGRDTLSNLTDKIKDTIKPSIYPIIEKIVIDGKYIIKITFIGNNKPYAYKGAFYIRVNDQNLIMDPMVIRELIKSSSEYNQIWENELTNYGIEFVDEKSLNMFYRQAVAMQRINRYEHSSKDLLMGLGLFKDDKLTNAGYYLFGKNVPLVYKAVVYPTTDRINPIDLKRLEGNIFNVFNEVIDFINVKMSWKVVVDSYQRKEIPEVPVIALREIVMNSLVHSDFYGETEHQITIDPKVIEIYNPGEFGNFTPYDYINENLPSRTKHKVIQGVLYKAFDIETLGRGLKRTDVYCKESNVKWSYKKYDDGFSFIFSREKDEQRQNLSKNAANLYKFASNNNGILNTIEDAMSALDKKQRTASSCINELVENNILERVGSRKSGYWRIKK